ncbi:hypothetical protein ACSYDW_14615 [Paeniglutamicibacter sp. R2-26]|uniref:hypothetical protein n=1 Tax=Paeniglutamicibacter sp. R2-26 TaxID=3144417 RepID=UPI003EE60D60
MLNPAHTPTAVVFDLAHLARPITPTMSARLFSHQRALISLSRGRMAFLLSLAQELTPTGSGDGVSSKVIANEGCAISTDALELFDDFNAWVYREAAHLEHDGRVSSALTALSQSIVSGGSDVAIAQLAVELAAWRVGIEQLLGGSKVSIPLAWPCPGCSGNTASMPLAETTVFVLWGLAICSNCAGFWEDVEIIWWASLCHDRMLEGEVLASAFSSPHKEYTENEPSMLSQRGAPTATAKLRSVV